MILFGCNCSCIFGLVVGKYFLRISSANTPNLLTNNDETDAIINAFEPANSFALQYSAVPMPASAGIPYFKDIDIRWSLSSDFFS